MNLKNKGFGLLFEMGCGKTLTSIAIMGALYQEGKIDRVLIVAPTSVVAVCRTASEERLNGHLSRNYLSTPAQ